MTERIEFRWLRPDGSEAVAVHMVYATPEEATDMVERCLAAMEEVRRAGTGSHAVQRDSTMEDHHGA